MTSESLLINASFPQVKTTTENEIININDSPATSLVITNVTESSDNKSSFSTQTSAVMTSLSSSLTISSTSSSTSSSFSTNTPVIIVTPSHTSYIQTVQMSEIQPTLVTQGFV